MNRPALSNLKQQLGASQLCNCLRIGHNELGVEFRVRMKHLFDSVFALHDVRLPVKLQKKRGACEDDDAKGNQQRPLKVVEQIT